MACVMCHQAHSSYIPCDSSHWHAVSYLPIAVPLTCSPVRTSGGVGRCLCCYDVVNEVNPRHSICKVPADLVVLVIANFFVPRRYSICPYMKSLQEEKFQQEKRFSTLSGTRKGALSMWLAVHIPRYIPELFIIQPPQHMAAE